MASSTLNGYAGWGVAEANADYAAKHGGQSASAGNLADQIYAQDSAKENAYIDQLKNNTQGQLDIMLKKLDTDHQLAVGNNDQQTAKFLESVANNLETQVGRIPYDYQKYNARELQNYGLGNTAISQNKQNALDVLGNHEKSLGLQQGQANQAAVGSLNARGLLTNQTPGGYNPSSTTEQPLTGLSGLAGKTAGVQNAGFANQFQGLGIQRQGVQNQFGQQQSQLDFSHGNTMTDLTDTTRRGVQDAGNAYSFGTQQAQLDIQGRLQDLERKRQELLAQDKQNSYTQAGRQTGVPGF